jgi:predicted DNA-binding transcriptional regulator AlpA
MDLVEIAQDLKEIRALLSGIVDRHISRKELADRLGVSAATLDRRVKAKSVPLPVDGRWPLSQIIEWESQKRGKL